MTRRLVLLTAAAIAALGLSAPAQAQTKPLKLPPAARTLSGCLDEGGKLSVLFLIDESSSLQGSDPRNRRVDGIRAALTGLGRIAEPTPDGRRREVEVMFTSFYGAVRPEPGQRRWQELTPASVDPLLAQAGAYERRHFGQDTDYATALTEAQRILDRRAGERATDGAPPVCTALIWFTDGRYELTDRVSDTNVLPTTLPYAPGVRVDEKGGGERAVRAGRRYLCKPGGLLDRMASDGVVTFTVALASRLDPQDSRFLKALTTGRATGFSCGTRLSNTSGYFLPATDTEQLLFAFSGLFNGTGNIPPTPGETCVPVDCPKGYKQFTTIEGLSRFVMQASTGGAGVGVRLLAPNGETRLLPPKGTRRLTFGGTTITQRWVSDEGVELQGDFDPSSDDWVGRWRYAFVDLNGRNKDAKPYSRVQFFTKVLPRLVGSPKLIRGEATGLEIELAGPGADSSALRKNARVSGAVTTPSGSATLPLEVTGPAADGRYRGTVKLPLTTAAPYMNVDVVAGFSGATGGTVASNQRRFRVPTALPEGGGYPLVTPLELRLDAIEGEGSTTGTLTVRGSSIAAGCVWVGGAQLSAPDEAGPVSTKATPSATAAACLKVGRGEARTIDLRFTPREKAVGSVRGTLPVHLRSDAFKQDQTIEIPVSFAMKRDPNVPARIAIIVALTLLGTAIPLLLLHLLNTYAARFPEPQRLRVFAQDATLVAGEGLRSRNGGGGLKSHYQDDFAQLAGTRRQREMTVDGAQLEAVASGSLRDRVLSLFRGPYGVATREDRPIAGGSSRPLRSWREGRSQEVPLPLAGTWLFYPTSAPAAPAANGGAAGEDAGAYASSLDDIDALLTPAPPPPAEEPPEEEEKSGPQTVDGRLVMIIAEGGDIDQGTRLVQAASDQLSINERIHQAPPPPPQPPAPPPAEGAAGEDAGEPGGEPGGGGFLSGLFKRRERAPAPDAQAGGESFGGADDYDLLSSDPLFGPSSTASPESDADEDDKPT